MLALMLAGSAVTHGAGGAADDEDRHGEDQAGTVVSLSAEQQKSIGIQVERAPAVRAPERTEVMGVLLDPETLVAALGERTAALAAAKAADAEVERLRSLYGNGGNVSLKMLEAAQADRVKSRSQAQLAAAHLAVHWGPLAAMPAADLTGLVEGLTRGDGVLVRVDVLGRQSIGVTPARALLAVDGVQVPGRVLGVLRQSGEVQGVGLLIAVEHAPLGLGAGARVPVTLLAAPRNGRLVRRDAIFYDERGAYVYLRLAGTQGGNFKFRAARIKLLFAAEDGWVVDGIDDDDEVVMRGAGALWSMQEERGPADSDED